MRNEGRELWVGCKGALRVRGRRGVDASSHAWCGWMKIVGHAWRCLLFPVPHAWFCLAGILRCIATEPIPCNPGLALV